MFINGNTINAVMGRLERKQPKVGDIAFMVTWLGQGTNMQSIMGRETVMLFRKWLGIPC